MNSILRISETLIFGPTSPGLPNASFQREYFQPSVTASSKSIMYVLCINDCISLLQ